MSRGVVLWPDEETGHTIRELWDAVASADLPSMAAHSHRRHQPHSSLIVADHLPASAALSAMESVPTQRIPLLVSAAGVFPGGTLFLACDPNPPLLIEQHRVHDAVRPLAVTPWPYFTPGHWTPHITVGVGLTAQQLAAALPLVLSRLPIDDWFDNGGVEDGTTGENWPAPNCRPKPCRL